MARYRCPRCHEITYRPSPFALCGICSAPLAAVNLEPEGREDASEGVLAEREAGVHVTGPAGAAAP